MVTASSGLNVRTGPCTTYSLIASLPYGARVTVVDWDREQGCDNIYAWAFITSPLKGWVNDHYLKQLMTC